MVVMQPISRPLPEEMVTVSFSMVPKPSSVELERLTCTLSWLVLGAKVREWDFYIYYIYMYIVHVLYVTVHVKRDHKSAKFFFELALVKIQCLGNLCSKFGVDTCYSC